jgi:hypothetical protein
LAPILANIFKLAAVRREMVTMTLYNLAMNIICFQFYGSNINGRFRAIASMTMKEGRKLIDKLYGVSSKTKSLISLGRQMITVTNGLADNLHLYETLLRPNTANDRADGDSFFRRHNGKCLPGDDGSKAIARMTDDLFGIYLPVTTLRAINNTQLKLSASVNELNNEQCEVFHRNCQGHGSQTAEKLYTYMTQERTASMLANVNTTLNTANGDKLMFSSPSVQQKHGMVTPVGWHETAEEAPRLASLCTTLSPLRPQHVATNEVILSSSQQESVLSRQMIAATGVVDRLPPTRPPPLCPPLSPPSPPSPPPPPPPPRKPVAFDDFGFDHPDFRSPRSSNISWTAAEVKYIVDFKSTCLQRDVFSRCLQSIVLSPDEKVRRMFHEKHIRDSSVLRDGVKNKYV